MEENKEKDLENSEQELEEKETVEEGVDSEQPEQQEAEGDEDQQEENNEVEMLKKKVEELTDRYQRTLAEFDNFRKRTMREKASMYDDGVRDCVEKFLGVVDNLERAVAVQEGKVDENDAFFKGVKMTLKQVNDTFANLGVETIPALGEKFDPNVHSAVAHEDNDQYGENEVMLEMLKGYKYKDKVIRHSMVKVAN